MDCGDCRSCPGEEDREEEMSTDNELFKLGPDELTQKVSLFLEKLLGQAGLDLTFHCAAQENTINIQIDGEDIALVLSKNARALYAINHLLNQAFYRRSSDGCAFVVDCRGYRKGRELELELMAQKAAENVKHSGKPLSLQPLPASERRVIHLALAEEPSIRTESEGTGLHRRVVILPAE